MYLAVSMGWSFFNKENGISKSFPDESNTMNVSIGAKLKVTPCCSVWNGRHRLSLWDLSLYKHVWYTIRRNDCSSWSAAYVAADTTRSVGTIYDVLPIVHWSTPVSMIKIDPSFSKDDGVLLLVMDALSFYSHFVEKARLYLLLFILATSSSLIVDGVIISSFEWS